MRPSDEQSYLYRIISTIGSGPDLETILAGTVALLTEATDCHACFIYFVEGDRVVLRAASSVYAHLEGKVEFSVDRGLTGWVATSRRSAFIRDRAMEDPRVFYVAEMEEERFQSMVSVPVFSRAGAVIAVINLHTEAPREFAPDDLQFLEHTASLVAGAVENARLYQEATDQVAHLTQLSRLSQRIAAAGSVGDLLEAVTSGCRQAVSAPRVEIYLSDVDGRMSLACAHPPRSDAPVLDRSALGADTVGDEARLAEAVFGEGFRGVPVIVPLAVGDELPGILCVLADERSAGARSVISAVAAHTAVALKHHELVGRLREENLVKDFFEALARGADGDEIDTQAARLGVDLDAPLVVVHAEPWRGRPPTPERRLRGAREVPAEPPRWSDLVGDLEAALASQLPGAVFDCRTASCRALVKAPPGRERALPEIIRSACERIGRDSGAFLAVGVSDPCRGRAALAGAFDEAASAADVGGLIREVPGVYTYEDLGPYRYVLSAEDVVRDRHQDRLGRLVEYDRRRGTELLRTLEVYLESRGNVVGTARTVYAHPNTLRQRLARIQHICAFDLDEEDWLSLGIAIKVVKLRLARESARERDQARARHPAQQDPAQGDDR